MFKSDISNLRLDEFNIKWPTSGATSCETRNKCGPTGPSTAFGSMKSFSNRKLKVSYSWKLGVRSSSNDDRVVSLRLPNWQTRQCYDSDSGAPVIPILHFFYQNTHLYHYNHPQTRSRTLPIAAVLKKCAAA